MKISLFVKERNNPRTCLDNLNNHLLKIPENFGKLYRSYQRFRCINEAKGSFCIELTLKPLWHVPAGSTPIRSIA